MYERHGLYGTPEYQSWAHAKQRCFNHRNKNYARYGGRGISMTSEWMHSFSVFARDMGARPDGMTLERRDVDGDYGPDNCVWATRLVQGNNTSRTRRVVFSCQTMSLKEACAVAEVNYGTVRDRVYKHGLSFYQAIAYDVRRGPKCKAT